MCRNITILRGLEPAASDEEIEAGARQYVRKISGIREPSAATTEVFEAAVQAVTEATSLLLNELPPRKQPPKSVPPLRRLGPAASERQRSRQGQGPSASQGQKRR